MVSSGRLVRGLVVAVCVAAIGVLVGGAVPVGRSAEGNVGEPAILFSRGYDLYWMRADGSRGARLTTASGSDFSPARSPNGLKIAFTSSRNGGSYRLWIMNVDGSAQTRLGPVGVSAASDPTWSPNGSKIAFSGSQTGMAGGVYVMNADGTGVVRLTDSPGRSWAPAWSPDGKRIAFVSNRVDPDPTDSRRSHDLWVMNADGTSVKRLTDWATAYQAGEIWIRRPAWSPDGSKIAFQMMVATGPGAGKSRIYVVNADGTNRTAITSDNVNAADPAWSKTGTRIAHTREVSRPDGSAGTQFDIYTMNPDGTGPKRLTTTTATEAGLAWRSA